MVPRERLRDFRFRTPQTQADVYAFGVLVWEIVSGADITLYQPLGITAMQAPAPAAAAGPGGHGRILDTCGDTLLVELPLDCPPVAARIFRECTRPDPAQRPSANEIVAWLRGGT